MVDMKKVYYNLIIINLYASRAVGRGKPRGLTEIPIILSILKVFLGVYLILAWLFIKFSDAPGYQTT